MKKNPGNDPIEKDSNRKRTNFILDLKEKLKCRYAQDDKLCGDIHKLYTNGSTQDKIAKALLSHECVISTGITKQVIAGILQDIMDPKIRKEIGRKRGNANLKHDSETQKEKGKKGGEKKILSRDKAQEMGILSHSNKSPANISKELYELRDKKGPTTTVEIGKDTTVPLIGNRDDILKILSQHLHFTHHIEKTPAAIRGMIEREKNRRKSGKEVFEEISLATRNILIQKYLDLQSTGANTFIENDTEYPATVNGMLSYIESQFGHKRTKQWFFRSLREYQKGIQSTTKNT